MPTSRRLGAEERREQLVQAGLGLIGEVPFDQLSADDVAKAVGVSKGLVVSNRTPRLFPSGPKASTWLGSFL